MSRRGLVLFSLVVCSMLNLVLCDRCCEINYRELPRYKLIKSKARSNQAIISRKKVESVDKCKEFASSKKALAFNYGLESIYDGNKHVSRNRTTASTSVENTCQALQCPEIYNLTTLIRDKNYKYYSMYRSYIPSGTSTLACIPGTGIFAFSNNNLNFSQAQTSCQKMNGSLAHIISEERTNAVAKFVSRETPSFVGLSNRDDERIWKNEFDEPLSCFEYRAWGEGQPSHSKGCVGLMQPPESNSFPFWTVVPCHATLPFVCEISPARRSPRRRNFQSKFNG